MKKLAYRLLLIMLCVMMALPAQAQNFLPGKTTEIRAEAFRGNAALTELSIPEGITLIGEKAFADSGLKTVTLPASLTRIADDAFENCPGLIATVSRDSYAHRYCVEHDIEYRLMENLYVISALMLEEKHFITTLTSDESCILTIDVLSEDMSAVLKSASAPVEGGLDYAAFSLPIPENYAFPAYFVLRAVLLDDQGNALCDPYITMQYTSAYNEFEASQPEDYAGDVVINFGDCGFGVAADGAIVIPGTTPGNHSGYTIPASYDPKPGQVLVITHADGTQEPIKVLNISDTGNDTLTVTADPNVTLSDLYKVFKLDGMADVGAASKNGGVARMQRADDDGNEANLITLSTSYTYDALTVSASSNLGVVVKTFYNAELFGDDYIEQQLYVNLKCEFKAKLSGETDSTQWEDAMGNPVMPEFTIYEGPISLIGAGAAVTSLQLKVSVPLEFKAEASGEFSLSITGKNGYKYTSKNGCTKIKEIDTDHDFEIKGSVTIKLGVEIALNAEVLLGILEGGISGQVGVQLAAVASPNNPSEKDAAVHGCYICCDIDVSLFAELKGSAVLNVSKKSKVNLVDVTLFSTKASLGKCYFSISNESDSHFGGKPHFGKGTCPNYKYRITVNTLDYLGSSLSGLAVAILKEGTEKCSGESPYTTWLYDGDYTARATYDSGNVQKEFTVLREEMEVTLQETRAHVVGTVYGRSEHLNTEIQPIPGAELSFQCTSDASLSQQITADENGDYEAELDEGDYTVTVSGGSEYETASFPLTIQRGTAIEQDYTLKRLEGSVTGVITDSDTGKIIRGATLVIKDSSYRIVWEGATDASGVYETYLAPGAYSVKAGKRGYESATYTFTVKANEETAVNGALKPLTPCEPAVVTFQYNGHTYAIHNCAVSWQLASDYCDLYGGHLVTFTDIAENEAIVANLPSSPKNCYWIGLCGSAGGGWSWITGEPLNFSNWAANEPNNEQNQGEGCVHIFGKKYTGGKGTKYPGDWNDTTNTGAAYASSFYAQGNFGFICEWDELR